MRVFVGLPTKFILHGAFWPYYNLIIDSICAEIDFTSPVAVSGSKNGVDLFTGAKIVEFKQNICSNATRIPVKTAAHAA